MKKLIICFILLTKIHLLGQNFEGKILYKNSFQSKLTNVSVQKFTTLIGSEQVYVIKGGDYLSITNGQLMPIQLYKNSTNKIYTKTGSSDTIYCLDASIEKSKIVESKIEETTEIVLGYKCKMLTLKISNGAIYTYFFSDKFKIDPDSFKNHNYSHWYSYLLLTKSIPLKTIIQNSQFNMVSVATAIEAKQISDSKFELPKDTTIKCE